MNWWKTALASSIVWTIVLAAGAVFMMQKISREAISPQHHEAWENKLGEACGMLFSLGHIAIWGVLWSRQRRKLSE